MTAERNGGQRSGTAAHLPRALLSAYAGGSEEGSASWTVEEHLEGCADCRTALAVVVHEESPGTAAVVDAVHTRLAGELPPVRRRRGQRLRTGFVRWAAPTPGPWATATLLVVLLALLLASPAAQQIDGLPLATPVLPLLGVAVGWGPHADPVREVVAGTARAGLGLVLRRAVVVLLPVIPALLVVGWANGTAPALRLLPALALTCGSLALGSVTGVQRAAAGLTAAWSALVVVPAHLGHAAVPGLLADTAAPWWALAAGVLALAVVMCRGGYLHPGAASAPRR